MLSAFAKNLIPSKCPPFLSSVKMTENAGECVGAPTLFVEDSPSLSCPSAAPSTSTRQIYEICGKNTEAHQPYLLEILFFRIAHSLAVKL